jgi:hypothetical protein
VVLRRAAKVRGQEGLAEQQKLANGGSQQQSKQDQKIRTKAKKPEV